MPQIAETREPVKSVKVSPVATKVAVVKVFTTVPPTKTAAVTTFPSTPAQTRNITNRYP